MIRVEAPGRLHFGLFNFAAEQAWPNVDGTAALPARQFGGVGLMIEEPGLVLMTESSRAWSALGPLAVRALDFAQRFVATLPGGMPPQRILIETAPPEHCGLGVGTQLGLAVAKALATISGHPEWDAVELAKRVGRGRRSAVGIHGFQSGGLIVEGGKIADGQVAPLLVRANFPSEWRCVVVIPTDAIGLHGQTESQVFARMKQAEPAAALNTLCRLVLLGLLPALAERDCRTFGEALYDFNARAGEAFAVIQGGRYADPFSTDTIAYLRSQGIAGVGQSSWGPAVFAVVEDVDRARHIADQLRQRHAEESAQIVTTAANTTGARV
jgi:beta-ribofuranosylaminobenzene 5'-phosphate synthase